MRRRNRVRVCKDPTGVFVWYCDVERCPAPDAVRSGASFFWEISQHNADEHVREWHQAPRQVPRDAQTPPGGTHFDWSETGYHVRVREEG